MSMLEAIVKRVHVNRISFLGGVSTAVGVALLLSPQTDIYGAALVAIGQGIDCVDGTLARTYDIRTKEGARLDPLLDKVKNFCIGSYIITREIYNNNIGLPVAITANYVTDYISQRARGQISPQFEEAFRAVVHPERCERDYEEKSSDRANKFGKVKASLQNITAFGYIAEGLYRNHIGTISSENQNSLRILFTSMLASAAVIGGVGVLKRMRLANNKSPNTSKAA